MLRDILQAHGVPPERTEERATLAVDKMGLSQLQGALQAKSQWQALKALASQPRHNFLWVKPDELDAQIRRRAQSRFRIEKKIQRAPKPKINSSDIDPKQLALIPGTFIHGGDGDDESMESEVTQIAMEEVGANRAGLAFGRVLDVLPSPFHYRAWQCSLPVRSLSRIMASCRWITFASLRSTRPRANRS